MMGGKWKIDTVRGIQDLAKRSKLLFEMSQNM